MTSTWLVRFFHPDFGQRVGVLIDDAVHDVSGSVASVADWLRDSVGCVEEAIAELEHAASSSPIVFPVSLFDPPPGDRQAGVTSQRKYFFRPHWLAPVDAQDVWAAGVTYERSRQARQEEAVDGGDVYARVYVAERPEIFFKARGGWVVGPWGQVGIRHDAAWSVPEPELGLVINPAMEVVGLVAGNDVSSRDIEGANPLYLPQAKIYTGSCSLGPGILLGRVASWPQAGIHIEIERAGATVFSGDTHTARIQRTVTDLVDYLGRCLTFPDGVVLLTGTGVVPPDDFTLAPDDLVRIRIDGVGLLENTVKIV